MSRRFRYMHPFSETDRRLERVFELVENRLTGLCTVEHMAEEACYSLFHFIRTFTQATLYSPYEYLIRRRVAAALVRILGKELRITDAAFEYSFESVEGFSRAVKRCCGESPSRLTMDSTHFLTGSWTAGHLAVYRWICRGLRPEDSILSGTIGGLEAIAVQTRAIAFEYLGQHGFGCRVSPRVAGLLISKILESMDFDARVRGDLVASPALPPLFHQLQMNAQQLGERVPEGPS